MTYLAHPSQLASPSSAATTILLAEPDIQIREIVTDALERENYGVVSVRDGQKVLDLLPRTSLNPDLHLLILEATLPQVNGLELCRLLRSRGYNLPILMISPKDSETDRVVGLEMGADDYLVKPFGIQEFVARCRALLRHRSRSVSTQPTTLNCRDLVLDWSTCIVTLRGQPLALSPKEFCLLKLFLQSPKQVWTREQLIDRIWGTDYIGDFKTVDVHIRWLREKIEPNPGKPEYIKTVRGFGYRLG
ncbi:response regulator transcription factor [Leptolyngbya sp. GB1-A1]|uniref:response regulator transcription factor n=1 Tax=Leptolyngbya sp. GB1-A1 TaxID=2933908 RepID=UPI003298D8FF